MPRRPSSSSSIWGYYLWPVMVTHTVDSRPMPVGIA